MDETAFLPAVELAALLRAGSATPRELVEAALRRIEAVDGDLNAFIEVDAERALAAAGAMTFGDERPFAGVPVSVQADVPVSGLCMNFASGFLAGHRPTHSAYLVRRLREAGFVIVGTTNLSEFAILASTESRHTGPTRNPWDPGRSPGGAAGGAAAAVAAGLVPVAQARDREGSLRIPAACCGLLALKPSRGRISGGPELGDGFLPADGVVTRTVADAALALDVLAGYEVGDASWTPRPIEPYVLAMRRDPGRLRVAVSAANPLGVEPDADSVRALEHAAELLQGLGHEVREADPALPGPETAELFERAVAPELALGISHGELLAGRPPREDEIEPVSRAVLERARATTAVGYVAAVAQLQVLARGLVAFFADYDVVMTPALTERPLPLGTLTGDGDPAGTLARSGRVSAYAPLWNVTGQPAVIVPVGFGLDGLPSAVQLVGRPLAEDALLQLAAQMELALPWAAQRPPVGP